MTLSSTELRKPKNWQDFETKVCVLFECILDDPGTQQNGRTGQPQAGVDVYGQRSPGHYVGVQCKKKYEKHVTEDELRSEVEKAKSFVPRISEFILITTAPRDQKIQECARVISEELRGGDHPFAVSVWGWDDVEDKVSLHHKAYKAFDPTWNPYVEQEFEMMRQDIADLKKLVSDTANRGEVLSSKTTEQSKDDQNNSSPLHGQITAIIKLLENGYTNIAQNQLIELKEESWSSASNAEKYRLLAGIAATKLEFGLFEEAGQLLVDAYNEDPNYKIAQLNKAKGLFFQNKINEAIELTRNILHENQDNEDAAGFLIQCLCKSDDCDDPLEEIPSDLLKSEHVLIAYSHFLRTRNDRYWVEIAKEAGKLYPKSKRLKVIAAEAILEILVDQNSDALAGAKLKDISKSDIDNAIKILTENALESIEKNNWVYPSIANNAALALRYKGELKSAISILDKALESYPNDQNVRLQRALIAMSQSDFGKVFDLLQKRVINPEEGAILALALEQSEKFSEALEVVEHFQSTECPKYIAADLLGIRLRIMLKDKEEDAAITLITQHIASDPLDIHLRLLKIKILRATSKIKEAQDAFHEALECITENTDLRLRILLCFEAETFDEHKAIVNLLKDRIATDRESEALNLLIAASINSGLLVTANEILETISKELRNTTWFLKATALLAVRIGDVSADGKLAQYLACNPNDSYMILIRLALWKEARREKDIERLLSTIPLQELKGLPAHRIQVASQVAVFFDPLGCIKYAYSVLLNNWNDPDAHMAYNALFFLNEKITEIVPLDNIVTINTTVGLTINGEKRRYRIEDLQTNSFNEERLTPNHELAVEMLGKQTGEEFTLRDGISEKIIKIEWVKSVYLDAFHLSLERFNERFPNEKGLLCLSCDLKSDDPLKQFRDITKARREWANKLFHEYKKGHYSLSFIGKLLGLDPIEIYTSLSTINIKFQICQGNSKERDTALNIVAQHKAKGCIVDAITLYLIFDLDIADAIKGICGDIYTTKTIHDLLLTRIVDSERNIDRKQGVISCQDDQLIYEEQSKENLEKIINAHKQFRDWAKKETLIAPALSKQELSQNALSLIETVGSTVCDPVIAADGNNLILIAEDYGLRLWATEIFNISSTWLQPVLILANQNGFLTDEKYAQTVIELALRDHYYVSLNAKCLIHQARKDNFEVSESLSSLLKVIGGPNADISSNSIVLAEFLDMVIRECESKRKSESIMSEVFLAFTSNRDNNIYDMVRLIYRRITLKDKYIFRHVLGWLTFNTMGLPYYEDIEKSYRKYSQR